MSLGKQVLTCVLGRMSNSMQHFLKAIRKVFCKRRRAVSRKAVWEKSKIASFACGVTDCAVKIAYSGALYRFFRLGASHIWCFAYAPNAKST